MPPFLKPLARQVRAWRAGFQHHDIALLVCDMPAAAAAPGSPLKIVDVPPLEARILAVHEAIGHRIAPLTIERRLRHGLRFVAFELDGALVASTWLASGARYIDELGWRLPIGPHEYWVRDVFVDPRRRGQKLFTRVVAALAQEPGRPPGRLWSDVDWSNRPSLRAHLAAGFRVVQRLHAQDLGGRWRWRSRVSGWPLPVAELGAPSAWLRLSGGTLERHRDLIA